ncbi:hypothetical protein QZH41_005883 [Actinostola sp. cb2023]|nr:hypothetical protein QZH41_005883 [Actinostola sp. cb2023]
MLRTCTDLNFMVNPKKTTQPTTCLTLLGIELDSVQGLSRIDDERLREILDLVRQWATRSRCTKRQLQSLLAVKYSGLELQTYIALGQAQAISKKNSNSSCPFIALIRLCMVLARCSLMEVDTVMRAQVPPRQEIGESVLYSCDVDGFDFEVMLR